MAETALVPSDDLSTSTRTALRELWDAAFEGDFTDDDAAHAFGGVHALITEGPVVVAHASAVRRTILVGDTAFATGYVEAVATLPSHHGRGFGRRVMLPLQDAIRSRFEFAVLSTGTARGFYERLGWEGWRGPSYVLRDGARVRTEEEDDGLMVLRFGPSGHVDLASPIACFDRPGDAW